MLSVCADVTLRYLFKRPLTWVLEGTEYALLYITFLVAAWLLKREGHVTVDIVPNRLEPKSRAILNFATSIVLVIVCCLLVWYGSQSTLENFQKGLLSVRYYELPKFAFLIIIPVGSFFLLIQSLKRTYSHFRQIKQ